MGTRIFVVVTLISRWLKGLHSVAFNYCPSEDIKKYILVTLKHVLALHPNAAQFYPTKAMLLLLRVNAIWGLQGWGRESLHEVKYCHKILLNLSALGDSSLYWHLPDTCIFLKIIRFESYIKVQLWEPVLKRYFVTLQRRCPSQLIKATAWCQAKFQCYLQEWLRHFYHILSDNRPMEQQCCAWLWIILSNEWGTRRHCTAMLWYVTVPSSEYFQWKISTVSL